MQVFPEKRKIIKEYLERKEFYDKFVDAMVIVDPLDRVDPEEFPKMNDESVKTVEELKQIIFSKTFFQGGNTLQLCLPEIMSKEFDDWVALDRKELSSIAEDFKNKTKMYGHVVQEKFSELPKVKHIYEKFEFFIKHNLHDHLKE